MSRHREAGNTPATAPRGGLNVGAMVLAHAARAVAGVASRGRSADDALAAAGRAGERAAVQAVTLGTLRWYLRLLPAVASLTSRQRRPLADELQALLVVATHQIEFSRNPPPATVHAAVEATRLLGQPHASGLTNAVLRRFMRERATLLARLDGELATATAHPAWLVRELERAWPERVASILGGNNAHPPMVLRIDRAHVDTAAYLYELAAAGSPGRALEWAPAAVQLERPIGVSSLPGFETGQVSVQDAGAQLAAPLLDARSGMRVLDACAAPGGKTLHLLEHTPDLAELVAVDVDGGRLERVAENLTRARRRARLEVLDVRNLTTENPDAVLGGPLFDRILVDAPCSSTGVIRRHPDIKLLRRPGDIQAYAALQLEILRAAFAVLAPGGRLLYCTCSLLAAENEEVVERFLGSEPRSRPGPMPLAAQLAPGALERRVGLQLLPGSEAATDGFYYACIEKTTVGD
jgi:16S rRNA (cytosine967-C5)-methyltransferase